MTLLPFTFFAVLVASTGVLTATLIPYLVRHARRHGWIDQPDDTRKLHERPTPPIGGMVLIPLYMILLPVLGMTPFTHPALFVALALILATGVWDDLHGTKPAIKLLAQVIAALILAISGEATITQLGHLFGQDQVLDLKFLAIPFTAVCFVFFINAMNMIDGVDGLSGGLAFIMLGWLAIAGLMSGNAGAATAAILMMALLFGFLVHNMRYPGHKRATVFIGDTGSMSLGLIIAWIGIHVTQGTDAAIPPISMAFVILLPILDAFALFITRKKSGRSPFDPGRDHMHYQLMSAGLRPGQVTVFLCTIGLMLGAFGVLGPTLLGLGQGVMSLIWVILLLGYTAFLLGRAKTIYAVPPEACAIVDK